MSGNQSLGKGEMMRIAIAAVVALALGGALPAYQYEISGYPPASSSATDSTVLTVETGRGHDPSVLQTLLEARFRTFLATDSGRLDTTPFIGFRLILR